MRLDVWSDVICPWCYLGDRRLDLALERLSWEDEVEVRYRSFQLDPRAPREPQDLERVLERKYGPGAFQAMSRRLTRLGAEQGIDYRFDRIQRVNTFDAHRLIQWAGDVDVDAAGPRDAAPDGEPGRQRRLVHRLFRAYFTDGADVADHATLLDVVDELDLDRTEAAAVLASGAYADRVRADQEQALDHQVTGVPAFVIEGTFVLPGAQEVDTFVRVLERARERLAPAQSPSSDDACAVDDPRC